MSRRWLRALRAAPAPAPPSPLSLCPACGWRPSQDPPSPRSDLPARALASRLAALARQRAT